MAGFSTWVALIAASPAGSHVGVSSGKITFFRTLEPDGRPLVVEGEAADSEGDVVIGVGTITDASGRRVASGEVTGIAQSSRRPVAVTPKVALLTLLFTDVVASTQKAESLGDDRWGVLLSQHHALVRHQFDVSNGREVKTNGAGFLVTFENPTDALGCALRIREAVGGLGLELRMGVHTGQCELSDGDVAGIAVHVASRLLGIAGPGEIVVSGTVRDLLLGTDFKSEERGRHKLKGIEGEWQLFALGRVVRQPFRNIDV